MLVRNALLACALFALSGCAIGPAYKRPAVAVPSAWRFEDTSAQTIVNPAWWEQFSDTALSGLVRTALKENNDVKIAAARVEEFIGDYWVARGAFFPDITANLSAGNNRISQASFFSQNRLAFSSLSTYVASISGTWEIDLWGKIRRATEAARATILGGEEAKRGVLLTLVTSVAGSYINLRSLDRQLEIAKETAKSWEEAYQLFVVQLERGIVSDLELYQTKSEYDLARAAVPALERAIAQQENGLRVLLGRNPGPIPRGKTIDQLAEPAVPAGLPSSLLINRPDIRQAEAALIAANARIGVARAQYLPSLSLTGLFGWATRDLAELFEGPALEWSYGASVAQTIFSGGARRGAVHSARAVEEQALFGYKQTILSAFRDVEDALIDHKKTGEQLAIEREHVEDLRTTVRVARLRYENGYSSFLDLLVARRGLFAAELSLTQTQNAQFLSVINIYKALGGGWITTAEGMSRP